MGPDDIHDQEFMDYQSADKYRQRAREEFNGLLRECLVVGDSLMVTFNSPTTTTINLGNIPRHKLTGIDSMDYATEMKVSGVQNELLKTQAALAELTEKVKDLMDEVFVQ